MQSADAETLALKTLAFLAADGDALLRFLGLSGLELADLRARATDPELLAAVLDFLLGDEPLLTRFAAGEELDVKTIRLARHALPGGPDAAY